jgi:hypothetical protein
METNKGVMGLFEKEHDGRVNQCIVDYCQNHTKKECFVLNNNMYNSLLSPNEVNRLQYETNRNYIIEHFKK